MQDKKSSPIGVFDSGFGGLEILREIIKVLPEYDYLYLGDTARTPYGTRSQEVICKFTEQAVDFLFKQGCCLAILACNTASSKALREIQQKYLPQHYPDRRVLGVLIPAAEEAIEKTRTNKVGVIATKGTISSKAFVKELKKIDHNIEVFQNPAPLLVAIVEAGEHDTKIADLAISNYVDPLIKKGIDTLILGCTHYGILQYRIKKIIGPEINLIVEGEIVAKKLKNYLNRHPEIKNKLSKKNKVEFLSTDLCEGFKNLGSLFFGKSINPQRINLG